MSNDAYLQPNETILLKERLATEPMIMRSDARSLMMVSAFALLALIQSSMGSLVVLAVIILGVYISKKKQKYRRPIDADIVITSAKRILVVSIYGNVLERYPVGFKWRLRRYPFSRQYGYLFVSSTGSLPTGKNEINAHQDRRFLQGVLAEGEAVKMILKMPPL